jgi:hypothetical protein
MDADVEKLRLNQSLGTMTKGKNILAISEFEQIYDP